MRFSLKLALPGLLMLLALMLCVTDVMAQPGGRGGRQGGGRGGADDNPQRLLRSESVQQDLELSDEQIKLIEKLNEGRGGDRGGDREAIMAELEGLSEEARIEKIRELRDARTKERTAELDEILLPHQMERLSQISAQAAAQGGLMNGRLAEKLEITDEQKERIRKKAEELQKEMSEKIAKLRQQMQAELLAELTPEQQDQYKQMMGETFTFERQQRGGPGGGPGGGRGGFGGDRGGRGGAGGDRGAGGGRGGDRGGRGGDRGGRGGDRGGPSDDGNA